MNPGDLILRVFCFEAAACCDGDQWMFGPAGHDAVAINAVLPSIVIAVPSVNGVIHRCDEYTSPEDLAAGGNVLLDMIRQLDLAGGSLDNAGDVK